MIHCQMWLVVYFSLFFFRPLFFFKFSPFSFNLPPSLPPSLFFLLFSQLCFCYYYAHNYAFNDYYPLLIGIVFFILPLITLLLLMVTLILSGLPMQGYPGYGGSDTCYKYP